MQHDKPHLPKQDSPTQQASSCVPDEALVRVSQVGPHGIALNAGEAVVGRLACHVDRAGAIGLKPSAGHHQPFTRQDAGQSPIAAAVATAAVRLLHTHKEQTSAKTLMAWSYSLSLGSTAVGASTGQRGTPHKQRIHI